jgi:L-alanine-DL-glutamate epimerase-like enolase superfamily enzyme
VKLEIAVEQVRLRTPFVTASGSLSVRELVLATLTDPGGAVGCGEAAPLRPYVNVSIRECVAALEDCRPVLAGGDSQTREEVLAACERIAVFPQATAAIDLALWDLEARRAGVPLWRLLGGGSAEPSPVPVNATIAAADRSGAATAAARAREAGFGCVKVKVGLGDDPGRLAAVRAAAGPEMAIRVDANGVWSVSEAVASLRALEPVGIELCEEPVNGLDELALVRDGTSVPIALDESAVLPGALDRRVGDAVCLKITSCGGITGLLAAGRRARAAGYEVYLASTLDGPLGIAAALHAAAVIVPDRPCGLATLGLFDRRPDPLPARRGRIELPSGPGLGDGLLDFYDTGSG